MLTQNKIPWLTILGLTVLVVAATIFSELIPEEQELLLPGIPLILWVCSWWGAIFGTYFLFVLYENRIRKNQSESNYLLEAPERKQTNYASDAPHLYSLFVAGLSLDIETVSKLATLNKLVLERVEAWLAGSRLITSSTEQLIEFSPTEGTVTTTLQTGTPVDKEQYYVYLAQLFLGAEMTLDKDCLNVHIFLPEDDEEEISSVIFSLESATSLRWKISL